MRNIYIYICIYIYSIMQCYPCFGFGPPINLKNRRPSERCKRSWKCWSKMEKNIIIIAICEFCTFAWEMYRPEVIKPCNAQSLFRNGQGNNCFGSGGLRDLKLWQPSSAPISSTPIFTPEAAMAGSQALRICRALAQLSKRDREVTARNSNVTHGGIEHWLCVSGA